MIFLETELDHTFVIEPEELSDHRGFFARTFCIEELASVGIPFNVVQCSISQNTERGTLRGLHYQCRPHEEAKIVRCTRGCIYDVVIDIRHESPTFKKWISVELSEDNNRSVYIPKGCAHGFQTLTDNAVVFYQMDEFFHSECARGVNFKDPSFQIDWPIRDVIISDKDASLENLE